jgi:cephalosporin hydroxylase
MTNIEFEEENKKNIELMSKDSKLKKMTRSWFDLAFKHQYSYHFTWLGRPIIQFPQDMIALQEIIWDVKPDIIIETGIAHGGSLIFSASMLQLIGRGKVIGIDIDIRKHNKDEIKKHPLYKRIKMIEGSSVEPKIIKKVFSAVKDKKKIMVFLDSNHTHEHVLKELEAYSSLVKKGSYIIVFDTMVEDMPKNSFPNRPWNKKNNPKTAVREFLKKNKRFKVNKEFEEKLLITSSPDGFLECVK